MTARSILGSLFGLFLMTAILAAGGCKEDDKLALERAHDLARSFHNAMMKRDVDTLVRLVDFPFNFDGAAKATNEAEFRRILNERWTNMFRKMSSAVETEEVTYEAFLNGAEVRGMSYSDPEEAKKQAQKVDFRENGVLVCCFHVDDETKKKDARAYYLVMQPNSLGDLKVVTYSD